MEQHQHDFGNPSYIDSSAEQNVRVWHADCNDKPEKRGQTVLGTPHLHICHLLVCLQGELVNDMVRKICCKHLLHDSCTIKTGKLQLFIVPTSLFSLDMITSKMLSIMGLYIFSMMPADLCTQSFRLNPSCKLADSS